jgi:TolA-binding protein
MSQSRPTDAEATAYAENYVLYGDQSRAWRIAFPSSKAKAEAVHAKASMFHRIDKVQIRIEELREKIRIQAEEKFAITTESLQRTLASVMETGLSTKKVAVRDQDGEMQIEDTETAQNLSAVVSAVSEVNKMNGNHAATRLAVGGDPNGDPVVSVTMTPEQYRKARKEALDDDDC